MNLDTLLQQLEVLKVSLEHGTSYATVALAIEVIERQASSLNCAAAMVRGDIRSATHTLRMLEQDSNERNGETK